MEILLKSSRLAVYFDFNSDTYIHALQVCLIYQQHVCIHAYTHNICSQNVHPNTKYMNYETAQTYKLILYNI